MVHVAVDSKYAGYIVISDEIKEDSRETIANLKKLGIKKTVMLTGGVATMWEAVFADVGVAIIAILNSMRVMRVMNV